MLLFSFAKHDHHKSCGNGQNTVAWQCPLLLILVTGSGNLGGAENTMTDGPAQINAPGPVGF